MTGAVKPPGGGVGPIDPLEANEVLGSTETAAPEQVVASQESRAPTGTVGWIERVDAGEISAEQAVDGIVADALEAPGMQGLEPAQREELESVLRSALLDDPTLSALLTGARVGG